MVKREAENLAELRRRAEAALSEDADAVSEMSPEEVRELVHELRTHQIELEMQNEELHRAQEELINARDRYSDLYDFAPVGYVTVGKTEMIEEANLTVTGMLGVARGQLIGQPFSRFVAPESEDIFFLTRRRALETRERETCEVEMVMDGGARFDAELTLVAVADGDGHFTRLRIAVGDITEKRVQERELVRLERLRAVGELSAGVSHNLNNILTNVLGPAQLLRRKTDDPELLREVDDIITSTLRARDLVHELHLSVRMDEAESLHAVSVGKVIGEAVQTSRPRWKDEPEARGISIEVLTRGEGVPPIHGTEAGLHDMLTNLISNAVDAMPQGGTIDIETRQRQDQVEIVFTDTGTGMSKETKLRLFEPFFTTKMGLGTGLGLSTVYRTVTNWGGRIDVESTPGKGTAFTLRLPVWKAEEVEAEDKAISQSTRSGKILIVDDDEAICRLLSRLLGAQHEVETFADGQKALTQLAQGTYDVAMIDLGMSGISGDRLVRQIRDIDPIVATVLITGWDLPDMDTRLSLFDFQIVKPFDDLNAIEDVVARAIARHDHRVEMGG